WPGLGAPGQSRASLEAALRGADDARRADVLISVGIGGSYLGNRVLHDALLGPGGSARLSGIPELRFAGFHLDPLELRALVGELRDRAAARPAGEALDVRLLAISKSGTTTETLATTLALREALVGARGLRLELV